MNTKAALNYDHRIKCIDDNAYFKFTLSRIENIRYINSYQSFNEHVEI